MKAKIEIKLVGNKALEGNAVYALSINGITAGPKMTYSQAKKEAEAMQSPNYSRDAWARETEVNY